MFRITLIVIVMLSGFAEAFSQNKKQVNFPSLDGIEITADLYQRSERSPFVILCHQARYSRGEYIETAPKLNEMGFSCLAVDLRSGDEVNGITNRTHQVAMKKGKPVNYVDAEQDILAAINYISVMHQAPDIILVGSSYSASLVLKIAVEHERVKAVAAFSPGEYFGSYMKIKPSLKSLQKPTFVTSSKAESTKLKKFVDEVAAAQIFVPQKMGAHGSKVLWSTHKDQEEYWLAFAEFMNSLK